VWRVPRQTTDLVERSGVVFRFQRCGAFKRTLVALRQKKSGRRFACRTIAKQNLELTNQCFLLQSCHAARPTVPISIHSLKDVALCITPRTRGRARTQSVSFPIMIVPWGAQDRNIHCWNNTDRAKHDAFATRNIPIKLTKLD
jgi:hypothetical protein